MSGWLQQWSRGKDRLKRSWPNDCKLVKHYFSLPPMESLMNRYELISPYKNQLFTISCNEGGWHGNGIILDSLPALKYVIDIFPVPPPEQMSVWIFIVAQAAKWTFFHCTCCMNFLWCFFLSTMPLMSPCSSAAFPNLLLFFIFIVSVVSILSWKLMQYTEQYWNWVHAQTISLLR